MSLAALLSHRLSEGPLPAAEFMALALYHPEFGYYRQAEGPWGLAGKDYYTALDGGPLLGETLAIRLESAWRELDRPGRFTVLEPGAGRGWLGRDLLNAAQGEFAEALVYLHQDDGPGGRRLAEEALAPFLAAGRAAFLDEAERPAPFVGAIFSNELFDALPAQPWRWTGETWEQELLGAEGSFWAAADPGEAGQWFAAQAEGGLQPEDGSVWCAGLPECVSRLLSPLQRGLFLAIDYGESAPRLLAKGADLRRYRKHEVDGRWWEDPGHADLTADLDFTRLAHLLAEHGLSVSAPIRLGRWIRDLAPLGSWEADWQGLSEAARRQRMENLLQLTLPGMLGERFKVLEAWKA